MSYVVPIPRLAALLVSVFIGQVLGQDTAGTHRALIRVTLNAAYQDTEATAAQVELLAMRIPASVVEIPPGDTISAFVARQYGFGQSDGLNMVYSAFERAILRLNGIDKPTDWKPGKRLAPTLPRWAKTEFNGARIANKLSQFSTGRAIESAAFGMVLGAPPAVTERVHSAPQTNSIDLDLPEAEALNLMSLSRANTPGMLLSDPLLLSFTMNVRFGGPQAGPASAPIPMLDPSTTSKLKSLVTTRPLRSSILFILDSGWPTDQIRTASSNTLRDTLATVRNAFKLGPPLTAGDSFPAFQQGPSNPHCQQIQMGLSEFEGIDQGRAV